MQLPLKQQIRNKKWKQHQADRSKDRKGLPVYLFNGTGSGSIIGFMDMGKFRKVRPDEYAELDVQQYARELLENEEQFKTWLRIHYGSYCMAIN